MQVFHHANTDQLVILFLDKSYIIPILYDEPIIKVIKDFLDDIGNKQLMRDFGIELPDADLIIHEDNGLNIPILTYVEKIINDKNKEG